MAGNRAWRTDSEGSRHFSSIKLYASRERHYVGLEGFGIQISSTEII
jgi:hypothetical protein